MLEGGDVANRGIRLGSLGALNRQVRRAAVAIATVALLAGSFGAAPAAAAGPRPAAPDRSASPTVSIGGSCQASPFGAPEPASFAKPRSTVPASTSFDAATAKPAAVPFVKKYRTPTTTHVVPGPSRNSPVTGYSLTTFAPALATASISGTVTGPDATPVAGIKVLAYGGYDEYEATTAADGTYTVDVAVGTYELYFYDPIGAHPAGFYSASGFVADYHDATELVVGANRTGIDIALPTPIWIKGTITGPGGGGIGQITVAAVSYDTGSGNAAKTAADGTYSIAVTPGSYLVAFRDEAGTYATGYYSTSGFTPAQGSATAVIVTAADVSGIDAELPLGIHIMGKVTSPTGVPLQGISVAALGDTSYSFGTTGADGTYSLVVAAGTFILGFADPSNTYPTGYYSTTGFKASSSSATAVVVTTADVQGINLKFPTPIYLRGTVTGPSAELLEGIRVYAISSPYDGTAVTAANGTWSIPVVAGTYTLLFSDDAQVYADGYYSKTGYQWDRSLATSVVVTTATVSGLNVHLPLVAHIRGVVTGPDDSPLPDMLVAGFGPISTSRTVTDADGKYSLPASHGTYHVGVADPAGVYVTGYYATGGFTTDSNAASPIAVASADITGINMKLPAPVYIRGTVTGPGGIPLKGIDVIADSLAFSTSATTRADGTFAISVVAGTYHVSYCDEKGVYGSGWYGTTGPTTTGLVTDPIAALPVVVATTDRTGIDAELPLATHISGTVTGTGGVPLPEVWVMIWDEAAMTMTEDITGADGTYSAVVGPGTYIVEFYDTSSAYASGYYGLGGFTTDQDSATPVTVTTVDVSGIDVQMIPFVPPTPHIAALPTWTANPSITVHWSATAGTNPIGSYDVRYRRASWKKGTGFGSYAPWKNETMATSASLSAAAGYTYCFSSRAQDWDGFVSGWTAETCTAVPLDDRSLTRGSGWTAKTGSAYYKSTYLQATKLGARLAAYNVTARQIAVVATTCPTCGSIKVYWGSSFLKTISLKSSTTVNKKLITVVVWSAPRSGTLSIKVASSGKKVIVDGVVMRRN
jgi:hypothetical protein